MKKNLSGYSSLWIILGIAALALLFGFLVIRKRINTPPAPKQDQAQQNNDQQTPQPDQMTTNPSVSDSSNWQTYVNQKHGFSVKYPLGLKVGAVSSNSVLGSYQVPIKGFHVGSLVFVLLKDPEVKQQADGYFKESLDLALHPVQAAPGEPTESCKQDKISNTNSNVVSVQSVSCNGEGGPSRYAYIKGSSYDVFVDGYSSGFDADYGPAAKSFTDADYAAILGSFAFTSSTTTQATTVTTTSTNTNTSTSKSTQNPTIQKFTITADDSSASPEEINVTAGNIVEITFSVAGSNVYDGGLDFRSSVVNSGTIHTAESKTISFKADKSFSFTPYWPASNIAKSYKIKVVVQ